MTILSIRSLRKVYKSGVEALNNVNLDVAAGDFFALLGPNGAGKSTVIGIVCSLINKTAGQVQVCGYDLDRDPQNVKRCIGLVPQEFNFNQFQPIQEIVLNQAGYYGIPRTIAKTRTEQFLKQLELWEWRDLMARELSGGMKRRLMIARALVHEPRLLILDEPTAGVDIEIRRGIWEFLRNLNSSGTSIILTTHYLEEVENLCRNLAVINQGKIVKQASLNSILTSLDTEVFVLNLRHKLPTVPPIPGYKIHFIDNHTLEVTVTQAQSLHELFNMLANANIEVISMRNKQNRLEQLLIGQLETGYKTVRQLSKNS